MRITQDIKAGITIQIKTHPYKKGDKTCSITIRGANVEVEFERLRHLYTKLSENKEVELIYHNQNG